MIISEYKSAQEFFVSNHNKRSLKYLHKRGFTNETIEKFGIGYNDDFRVMNLPELNDAITVPHYDMWNRVVAFYCRAIGEDPPMKHMSSQNYPWLYEKGRMFFNLNRVMRKYYNGTVFIVEGHLDCISMDQLSFPNTIALCGNTLTQIQKEILYRYFKKVYFILDADKAGDNMTKFLEDKEDDMYKYKKRYKDMKLYKIKIESPYKDVNDLLKNNVDIKSYLKKRKELIE